MAGPLRDLHDLMNKGGRLGIKCKACFRKVIFETVFVLFFFNQRRWSIAWEDLPRRFRCWDCGSKRLMIYPIPRHSTDPVDPFPPVIEAPYNLDVREWRRAGPEERRKMLQRLRN